MLIITIVLDQYTFDDFHKDRDIIYRINTNATGMLTIVILGSVTIASQTLRAARANPVNSLRYE